MLIAAGAVSADQAGQAVGVKRAQGVAVRVVTVTAGHLIENSRWPAASSIRTATPISGKFEKNPRRGIGPHVIAVRYVVLSEEAVASS